MALPVAERLLVGRKPLVELPAVLTGRPQRRRIDRSHRTTPQATRAREAHCAASSCCPPQASGTPIDEIGAEFSTTSLSPLGDFYLDKIGRLRLSQTHHEVGDILAARSVRPPKSKTVDQGGSPPKFPSAKYPTAT
jgi:hypothetical protein